MKKRKKQKKRKLRKEKKTGAGRSEITGVFSRARDGFGFVMDSERKRPDVYIPVKEAEGLLSGDIVTISVGPRKGKGPRGRILKIEQKKDTGFLAVIREYGGILYGVPDDRSIGEEVYLRNQEEAVADHRVLIGVDRESLTSGMPKGRILEDFGHCDDPSVDLPAVMRLNGYTFEYPSDASQEAEQSAEKEIDYEGREDLRDLYTCTIDPAQAKDFDDAISVAERKKEWEVWVHIADVSHYVRGGGALDDEAAARSNSVYLLNRVIPMLPECLSNEVCSLSPGTDKAAKSVRMLIDRNGNITEYRLCRSVIRSDRRFTYDEVQDIIQGGDDADKAPVLAMYEAASALRKFRNSGGSINLELPEVFPVIHEDGSVKELQIKVQKESNQLVEDMMLAANRCMAELMQKKNLPGPFRIHQEPEPVKKKELGKYLGNFGLRLKPDFTRRELNDVIDHVSGKNDAYIVNLAILRSFKQAEYSTANEGHFALAFRDYLHFTSPIRRYPDLAVHRTLDRVLFDMDTGSGPETGNGKARAEMVRLCNENERKAMKAENSLSDVKILRYMKSLPGDTVHTGVVSRIEEFYLAVELTEYFIYGRLYLSDIEGEFHVGKKGLTLREGSGSRKIRIGTEVQVTCSEIDPFSRTIELKLSKV